MIILTPILYYFREGKPFVLDLLFVKIMAVIFLIYNLPNFIIYLNYYQENRNTKIKIDTEFDSIGIIKNGISKQYKISEIESSIYHLGVYHKNRIDNARRWKMINSDLAYWDLKFNNGDRFYISNFLVDFLHEKPIIENTKFRFRMFQYINKSDSKEAIELKAQKVKTRVDRLRELYSQKSVSELEYIVKNEKIFMENAREVAKEILKEKTLVTPLPLVSKTSGVK